MESTDLLASIVSYSGLWSLVLIFVSLALLETGGRIFLHLLVTRLRLRILFPVLLLLIVSLATGLLSGIVLITVPHVYLHMYAQHGKDEVLGHFINRVPHYSAVFTANSIPDPDLLQFQAVAAGIVLMLLLILKKGLGIKNASFLRSRVY